MTFAGAMKKWLSRDVASHFESATAAPRSRGQSTLGLALTQPTKGDPISFSTESALILQAV